MDLIIIFLAKNGNSKKNSLDHTDPLTLYLPRLLTLTLCWFIVKILETKLKQTEQCK